VRNAAETALTAQAKPALKLVKTQDMNREEWLEVRKRGIGSSDAASVVGLSPYKSQLELWLEKTGRDEGLPQPDPQDEIGRIASSCSQRHTVLLLMRATKPQR